jgi:hypothetical protein
MGTRDWASNAKKMVQVRNTEQEEDGYEESEHASSDRVRENSSINNTEPGKASHRASVTFYQCPYFLIRTWVS